MKSSTKGHDHGNADGLSRLPMPGGKVTEDISTIQASLFNLSQIHSLPVTAKELANRDPARRQVTGYVQNGWSSFIA